MTYFKNIANAVSTIFEGLTITSSHMFRRPITVQYPDRTKRPVIETLPERYRGFLDVDMGKCMGCMLCMQACPIQCIDIEITKQQVNTSSPFPPKADQPLAERGEGEGGGAPAPTRLISKFDIDIGKCMFCGLCTEVCPTNAIHFTREFERATPDLADLTFKFVEEGKPVVPYKKGG